MSLFKDTLIYLEENKRKREEGKLICIPFPFKRISQKYPGTQVARYDLWSANSKVGKTKITDFIYTYHNIDWIIKNKNKGIDYKVDYFSLEASEKEKALGYMCYRIYLKHGVVLDSEKISSVYEEYILTDEHLKLLREEEEYFTKHVSKHLNYISGIRNKYGIYKHVKNFADNNGVYVDKITGKQVDTDLVNKDSKVRFTTKYVPNNPDLIYKPIVDHLSLFTIEKMFPTLKLSMDAYSKDCISMRNRWGFSPTNVQQQANAQESLMNKQANMMRPSANGLSDSKDTAKDINYLFGLFSPHRMEQTTWPMTTKDSYDITRLKDNYRELSLIMNRHGSTPKTHLYFNGAVNYFEELPKNMTNEDYKKYGL